MDGIAQQNVHQDARLGCMPGGCTAAVGAQAGEQILQRATVSMACVEHSVSKRGQQCELIQNLEPNPNLQS